VNVISASRRTDLIAFFPEWLSKAISVKQAIIVGPSGNKYKVNLDYSEVHTFVLWSKNFSNLIQNKYNLLIHLSKYSQLYFLFTITGLGGTFIESQVPSPLMTISQIENLIKIAGTPERISIRFDPIVYWNEKGTIKTNLYFFEDLAPLLKKFGIKKVRFSFAQWYEKCKKRAKKYNFQYLDPSTEKKKEDAKYLAQIARTYDLELYACSQSFLTEVEGIEASSCIDGNLLIKLHPKNYPVSIKKDKSQRKECRCTESIEIGSYTQVCPHSCLYCYANPRI
jgi:DNA repair photolyase